MRQIDAANVGSLDGPTAGESADAYVDAMVRRVIASGHALVLLGGLLAPAELELKHWTPAVAAEMTAFLGGLMSDDDKLAVRGLIAQTLLGFFLSAIGSAGISPTSSVVAPPVAAPDEPIAMRVTTSTAGA